MKNWLFALLLVSPVALANWSMEVHLLSQHFGDFSENEENENNYGLGLGYKFSKNWSVLAGIYRNSLIGEKIICQNSVETETGSTVSTGCSVRTENYYSRYLSFERSLIERDVYEFGFDIGVADGYKEHADGFKKHTYKSDYLPMAGPYINIGDKFSLKLRYMFYVASLGTEFKF